ncbi:acyltransferase family protein [Niastella koreensis]
MQTKKQFFPLIDSLRAFAVFIVIFFHGICEVFCREHGYYYPFSNGYLGVDLFFVLSGFLITNVLLREYLITGKISIKNFYVRRVLRLYPPIILAMIIFVVPLSFFNFRAAFSNFFFMATYTGDIVMLFRHFIPYLEYPLYFSHCWSLAIEEQFYIFYPTLLIIFLRVFGRKKISLSFLFFIFNVFFLLLVVVGTLKMGGHFYKFFLWRFF